ncbi:Biopolymer transport protein ExbD/TolR [Alkalidesulfovibrio alkalitolerans DSM 16529]|uniref:Biopolymer transport protein ExbD/TolR n=1 Tax=Alkalidesulfovibrio alkalitolerans DSM 16529 TaxID=1121439 RepID=S7URV1_9BACT|nr:biopolymer transporter ExbD [Alkalidesulfovibrio alkalitolerans]EPR35048.1 Biopolymer transport protein ExbD/TolR [Alkalidesulfovibrio alkalitolerans DSM 16529]
MAFDYRSNRKFLTEMNLTPLMDLVFNLLIIFMISAPLMTQGLDVDLPETKAAQELPADKDHLILTVDRSGRIFVDEFEVKVEELENYLKKLVVDQKKALYMKADGDVPYGVVVKVMGEAKAAGIDKLGMVAEQTRDALQAPKLPEKK